MSLPLIIIGAGGHAKVLLDALQLNSRKIIGIVDADPAKIGSCVLGIPVLGDDTMVLTYRPDTVSLVNGLGSVARPTVRRRIFEMFISKGYNFASVIHPAAVIAATVALGEGVQVMAGAVVQPGCRLGANTLVNTRASVDHDCMIGAHVHIAPGVTLSGDVTIGSGVHIGTGATLVQGIVIGDGALVAAGAVVVKDIPEGSTVMGVPARSKIS